MNNTNNPVDELGQLESDHQQQNSTVNSIDLNPVDLVEIVVEIGKGALDVASSIIEKVEIDF
ncbi:hypothetical protein GCM10025882_30960 [Acinetobacter gyllenbergii]|uniref:Uncharacterized protein n=1 Tax=Acinetobacter gyllenbergii CIP 110306 = MTCC 11365 TaxID=1217657 RepID=A0A829HGF1_9GAMM|nr:hypothetical protein [Acinetobacter gyllenbergii]EPF81463.1 hypothetical protein F957_02003 [Acinetobacter gyllenbergii CIP 110306 = MTCC 11365]EPH36100.1 hypothetical protein L293_0694 [Acinetobacter gyllenbergii CIP 110306 = MTCC 11365]GMA12671.1 hypothetical protein GCM10025882_30960 [Acinetobacter gyllenbergii]